MALLTYDRYIVLSLERNEFNIDEFERYEFIASHIIKSLIGYQVEEFSSFIKEQIETAVATQIDYIYRNEGTTLGGSSFSLGKFSWGGSSSGDGDKVAVAPMVYSLLEPTGLMYRGI